MQLKKLTKLGGILYLTIFIAVPLSYMIGKGLILVSGDAAATAANIVNSEGMFRFGLAGEAVVFLVEVLLAGVLYPLLKPVSPSLSLAAAFARLGEAVIQAVNLLTSVLALLLASGSGYLAAIDAAQRQALAMAFLESYDYVILIWGFFFGLHLFLLGYLVQKSGFFPKLLGTLLLLAGVGYLLQSFGTFALPQFEAALSTVVLVLAIPGEIAFTYWLLRHGVDEAAWKKKAAEQLV